MIFDWFLTLNCTNFLLNFSKFDTNTVKPSFLHLSELGCHQPVKLRIPRELVDKRHKGAADLYAEEPYINKDEEPDIAEDDETQDEE